MASLLSITLTANYATFDTKQGQSVILSNTFSLNDRLVFGGRYVSSCCSAHNCCKNKDKWQMCLMRFGLHVAQVLVYNTP